MVRFPFCLANHRLTYWVVYGAFTFIESFVSIVLYWFPFYYTFKTLAIVWLALPQTQGAKIMYHKVVRPVFLQFSRSIGVNPVSPATTSVTAKDTTPTATTTGFST